MSLSGDRSMSVDEEWCIGLWDDGGSTMPLCCVGWHVISRFWIDSSLRDNETVEFSFHESEKIP